MLSTRVVHLVLLLVILPHSTSAANAVDKATRLLDAIFPKQTSSTHDAQAVGYTERLTLGRDPDEHAAAAHFAPRAADALTYGEFPLEFFEVLVRRALTHAGRDAAGTTLVDYGSGCGRLVYAAAVLFPELERVVGIEVVESLHKLALQVAPLAAAHADYAGGAPVSLMHGDASSMLEALTATEQMCVFAYSTAFASADGLVLDDLSAACARLPVGSRIVTTDRQLAPVVGGDECLDAGVAYRLLATFEGPNAECAGSTGYVWELVSLS